jgi:hypothetical protein
MEGADLYYANYLPDAARAALHAAPSAGGVAFIPFTTEQEPRAASASVLEDFATAKAAAGQLESQEALAFVARVFRAVGEGLGRVLRQRGLDRAWIDSSIAATTAPPEMGPQPGPLGQVQAGSNGYIPFGPLNGSAYRSGQGRRPVAPLPAHLRGPHVCLFGPAEGVKSAAAAMNARECRSPDEPDVVSQLLQAAADFVPMWGADDEDSRTPLRAGILASLHNVLRCLSGTLPEPLVAPHLRSLPQVKHLVR